MNTGCQQGVVLAIVLLLLVNVASAQSYTAVGQAAASAASSASSENATTASRTGETPTVSSSGGARSVPQISDFSLDARREAFEGRKAFTVGGYIQPTFGLRYRPDGLPRDQFDYSAAATQLGFIVSGEPVSKLSYVLHVVATGQMLTQRGNPNSDKSGGTADGKTPLFGAIGRSQLSSGVRVEQVTVAYQPVDSFRVRAGQMRVPFTVDQFSGNTRLMFPTRSAPTQVFLRGTDLGALAEYRFKKQVRVSAGVFNGARVSGGGNSRGLLYSARADYSPLGRMPLQQADFGRGGFRVGVGAGLVYLATSAFDSAGFASVRARDLRASASLRLAYKGFYFQAEGLRRQRTDSLTARPLVATGGYGQASMFMPIKGRLSIAPIGRFGWTQEDQAFSPRDSFWAEAGATVYLGNKSGRPDDMSLTLQYLGERRVTDNENAHGTVFRAQLRW